jgi:beta-1,2-mannobiose phosphorylase / 1,2-beta-oligomannan phosphorylase
MAKKPIKKKRTKLSGRPSPSRRSRRSIKTAKKKQKHIRGVGKKTKKVTKKIEYYGGFWNGQETIIVGKEGKDFKVFTSTDGVTFAPSDRRFAIEDSRGVSQSLSGIRDPKFSRLENGVCFLTFGKGVSVSAAVSRDGFLWKKIGSTGKAGVPGYIVESSSGLGAFYFSRGGSVRLAKTQDGKEWKVARGVVIAPRTKLFDSGRLEILLAFPEGDRIAIVYASHMKGAAKIGMAMTGIARPEETVWRSDVPLWEPGERIKVFACVREKNSIRFYYQDTEGRIQSTAAPFKNIPSFISEWKVPSLDRFDGNPILEPNSSKAWESKATFNPTAIHDDGKVHIIYRAIGDSDQSVLGYASSRDGVHIDERLKEPMYVPREPFEGAAGPRPAQFDPSLSPYMSGGGGCGGCEDPRIVRIEDRYYMTYVAYDGGGPPRVALTSISREDFLKKNWKNWEKPVLISAPHTVNKNACIFPEKIKGKYVILHRIFPNIQVDFVDDLDFDGAKKWLEIKGEIKTRDSHWDSRKLGAGAAPIKTKDGWLLIYQGVDDRDDGRYKVGAMLLDLKDPRRVLVRARHPIMEPEAHYENGGYKGGVVYPCGAVVVNDTLFVYYGAGDTVACVATAPFKEFLRELASNRDPKIEPVKLGNSREIEADGVFN